MSMWAVLFIQLSLLHALWLCMCARCSVNSLYPPETHLCEVLELIQYWMPVRETHTLFQEHMYTCMEIVWTETSWNCSSYLVGMFYTSIWKSGVWPNNNLHINTLSSYCADITRTCITQSFGHFLQRMLWMNYVGNLRFAMNEKPLRGMHVLFSFVGEHTYIESIWLVRLPLDSVHSPILRTAPI